MPDDSSNPSELSIAAQAVPAGAWAVAVSGGADSVALLELLRHRADLSLHVIHLDHETRAGESEIDAQFVQQLAATWNLTSTIARRSEIESAESKHDANLSARYRAARQELFRRVVAEKALDGVVLAHHADDQAETVMLRLVRGSGPPGLMGMSPSTIIGGVRTLRPLLAIHAQSLRALLRDRGIAWREDASNQSPIQQRNRARKILQRNPAVSKSLIDLAAACREAIDWLRAAGPELDDSFDVNVVARLSPPIARESLRRWLSHAAGPGVNIPAAAADRLAEMACDLATPSRANFPGGLLVCRRGRRIFVDGRT